MVKATNYAPLLTTVSSPSIHAVIRHRLDDAAKERPFFYAVLEGLYRERTFVVYVGMQLVPLWWSSVL